MVVTVATAGAAGGAVNALTTGVLSGDKPKAILTKTWNGAVNGFVSGGATGGLLGGFGVATSSVTSSAARYAVDTLGETAVDTIVDAAQGGQITPGSLAASLALNAATEGISARAVKGVKADVDTKKPTGGDSTKLGRNMLKSMGVSANTGWKGYQAQHIIPVEFINHPLIQKVGMDFDDVSNGIFLPTPSNDVSTLSRHSGYHSTYNTFVKNQLDIIDINQPSSVVQQQLIDLQDKLRTLQQNGLPLYPSQGATVDLWQRSLDRINK